MHEQQPRPDRDATMRQAIFERQPQYAGPQIYLSTRRGYEQGRPFGWWLPADQSAATLERAALALVQAAPAGHQDGGVAVYAQCGFGRYPPGMRSTLADVAFRAQLAREDVRAFHAWATLMEDASAALAGFFAAYRGRYDSAADWLSLETERAGWDRLLDERLPPDLRPHVQIDMASLEHELRADSALLTAPDPVKGGVFVFRGDCLTKQTSS